MRILIEAHHPAHIHFFKHAIWEWRRRGDDVLLLGRDRDVMQRLLEVYDWIPSMVLSSAGRRNRFPILEMIRRQSKVMKAIRDFRPDVVASAMGSYTQSAALLGVPNVVFTDSEHQTFNHRIAHPFATRIVTPACFWKDLGPKQTRYSGYHELAFLHPKRFRPRREVLDMMGGVEAGSYVICRVSAWNTLHDIGGRGFGDIFPELMETVSARAPVFVAPEGGHLPAEWESSRLRIPPDYFHDALAFARLVVSEGASTASEAACLGVPVVYVNTAQLGYLHEQEFRYRLVSCFQDSRPALERVMYMLDRQDEHAAAEARNRLLADHEDVTDAIVRYVDEVASLARDRGGTVRGGAER